MVRGPGETCWSDVLEQTRKDRTAQRGAWPGWAVDTPPTAMRAGGQVGVPEGACWGLSDLLPCLSEIRRPTTTHVSADGKRGEGTKQLSRNTGKLKH